jgi:two-component system, OmpR family, phosphate regulon response regulator PhoB
MMMADGSQFSLKGLRVGVVEDNADLCVLLEYNLKSAGYAVQMMNRGDEAETCLNEHRPDILILDWMLPGLSGVELLRRLRRRAATKDLPIIVLTARTDKRDVIRALETGADDFLTKPFSVRELLARIEALLRRRVPKRIASVLTVGDTEIDRDAMLVRRRGKIVDVGPTDLRLLDLFMTHAGKVLARQDILNAVWGQEAIIDERTIDVQVGRLRKALLTAWRTDPITTLRGAGYRFDPK